jgi:predicted phage terminase large subunit-like protein
VTVSVTDLTVAEREQLLAELPDGVLALLGQVAAGDTAAELTLTEVASRVLPDYLARAQSDYLIARFTEAVEAVEAGGDVRLIVALPPGSGKSSLGSVALPLWCLARNPSWEVGIVSAELSLALKFSRDVRRAATEGLVPVQLAGADGTTAAGEWETTARGGLLARGIGGAITGRRLKVLIVDDPIKSLADAYSSRTRQAVWDHWQGTLKTRLRQGGSLVVVIQTRWHGDDLAGKLEATGDWDTVTIPAVAREGDVLGRAVGEPLLSPQTFETPARARARLSHTRTEVGERIWAALYQQTPSPETGMILNRDWWEHWDTTTLPSPTEGLTYTSWDLTFGSAPAGSGDYVVGQVWQRVSATAYLLDQVRGQWTFTESLDQIRGLATRWPQATTHLVEKAANGAAAIDTLKREIRGIVPVPPRGSKEIRALAVAPQVEAGQVFLPPLTLPWVADLLTEVTLGTAAPHDDQLDALTQALNYAPGAGGYQVNSKPQRTAPSLGGFRTGKM